MKKTLLTIFSIVAFLFLNFNHLESFELMSSWYNTSRLNNTEWLTINNDYQNNSWIHNNGRKDYEKWVNKYNYSTSLNWTGGFNLLSGTFPYWSYQLNAESNTWAQQLDNSYHSFDAFNDSKFGKFVWNDPYFGNYSYYFPSISPPSLLFQINFFSLRPSSSKSPKLKSITVTPASFQLLEAGSTETLIVKGNYSDGSIRDLTQASTGTRYLSSDQGVATIDADGLITAMGEGEVIITVANGELSTTVHGEVNPEKVVEFDPGNPSHHHVEGVLLGGVPTDVITCCDCHNPHYNTTMENGYPLCDPYSIHDLYPAVPLPQVTLPLPMTVSTPSTYITILISGLPFYNGNITNYGIPTADLFCLECHAPDIFMPPNPPWPGAANISFEIISKYYDPNRTASNFFYPHRHLISDSCDSCHLAEKNEIQPYNDINGHFNHVKNASCTYCHDPHGTTGTFEGEAIGGIKGEIEGLQRGHLLKDWILVDSTTVNPLPYSGGYQGRGIYSPTTLSSIDGASSCFVNDPLGGCHTISHIHPKIKVDSICNTSSCHSPFSLLFLRETD